MLKVFAAPSGRSPGAWVQIVGYKVAVQTHGYTHYFCGKTVFFHSEVMEGSTALPAALSDRVCGHTRSDTE